MKIRKLPFCFVIALALAIGGLALTWALVDMRQVRTAPDVTFESYDGQHYHLADLRGQVVVVNFWASWCAPCRAEAPILQQAWLDLRDRGVMFIGVAQGETRERAEAYLREYGISYPNVGDTDNRLTRAFGVQGLPTTFVIDRSGVIRDVLYAAVKAETLRTKIEGALGQ